MLLSRRDVVRAFFPGPPFSGSLDHSYGIARWSARYLPCWPACGDGRLGPTTTIAATDTDQPRIP